MNKKLISLVLGVMCFLVTFATVVQIKTVNGTIIFTYEDGFDENQIILEYNNGHFEYE